MAEKICDTCCYCMGRSEYDAICEKTKTTHPKDYTCHKWKGIE